MSQIILENGSFVNEEIQNYFKEKNIVIQDNYGVITYDLGDTQDAESFEENYNKGNGDFNFENFVTVYENEDDEDEVFDISEEDITCYCEIYFDITNISFEEVQEFVEFVEEIC